MSLLCNSYDGYSATLKWNVIIKRYHQFDDIRQGVCLYPCTSIHTCMHMQTGKNIQENELRFGPCGVNMKIIQRHIWRTSNNIHNLEVSKT